MKTTAIKVAQVLLWVVYVWVTITLVLLLLLFILQLMGANPTAGFVEWVYRSTERAMAPFRGIFEPITVTDKSVLDISVLFAMIVYTFVGLGLHVAIDSITRWLRTEERHEKQRAYAHAQTAAASPGHVLQLTGPSGVQATAVLTGQPYGTSIELTASGLDPFHTYTAWLEGRDGARVSTATFQPNTTGTVQLALATAASLTDSRSFGLTLLPGGAETTRTDVLTSPLA